MKTQISFSMPEYGVNVWADVHIDKGCHTLRNGDPGWPPSTDIDGIKIEVVDTKGHRVEITDDLELVIQEALEEKLVERIMEAAQEMQ